MSSLNTSTLRPGLLVSLSTSIRGNVRYDKTPVRTTKNAAGEEVAEWETTRVIVDPEEYERAKTARNKAGSAIRTVCAGSAFGLLCPEADSDVLAKAIGGARQICDEFNSTAALTRISVYVITGRIAPDDVEAVKAINSEVRDLLAAMEEGVKNCDVKVIREAASKAKDLGQMLSPDAATRIQMAVEAARGAARKLVAAGEQAAKEVDTRTIRQLTEARTAFLDLDVGSEVQAPQVHGRALDLAPTPEIKAAAPVAAAIDL